MEFVLNPTPLPIDCLKCQKAEGMQYYQWQYKQKLLKQEHEQKMLTDYLINLERQQVQQQKNNQNHRKRIREQGTFYQYNIRWKKKIQNKIEKQKILKNQQLIKIQQKQLKKQSKQSKKQIIKQYKGPIEGWDQHFQNYIKIKSIGLTHIPQQVTFQPKINQRSKKIAQGMTGRVQDRLILFGQFLKMKLKQQQMNKDQSTNRDQHKSIQKTKKKQKQKCYTDQLAQQQIFNRLFKQGEEAIKKKKQLLLNQNYTFKPKINKLSDDVQNKIMKLRKPLYYIKQNKYQLNIQDHQKKNNKSDFQAFLKRNEALLNIKKKLLQTMKQKIYQKQNIQRSKCTFTPILNTNSKKINKSARDMNKQLLQPKSFKTKLMLQHESQTRENPIDNIDISKLTVGEQKQISSRFDQSDSLSCYKMESSNKESEKEQKKQRLHYSTITHSNIDKNIIKQQNQLEKIDNNKIYEDDSIQNMKNFQWETQLQQIQNHLQNMMLRTPK